LTFILQIFQYAKNDAINNINNGEIKNMLESLFIKVWVFTTHSPYIKKFDLASLQAEQPLGC